MGKPAAMPTDMLGAAPLTPAAGSCCRSERGRTERNAAPKTSAQGFGTPLGEGDSE